MASTSAFAVIPFATSAKLSSAIKPRDSSRCWSTREDRIRGVAVVGNDAIDIIGEAIALIDRGATARDAADMPHLHPTMSEIFGRVADDFATA